MQRGSEGTSHPPALFVTSPKADRGHLFSPFGPWTEAQRGKAASPSTHSTCAHARAAPSVGSSLPAVSSSLSGGQTSCVTPGPSGRAAGSLGRLAREESRGLSRGEAEQTTRSTRDRKQRCVRSASTWGLRRPTRLDTGCRPGICRTGHPHLGIALTSAPVRFAAERPAPPPAPAGQEGKECPKSAPECPAGPRHTLAPGGGCRAPEATGTTARACCPAARGDQRAGGAAPCTARSGRRRLRGAWGPRVSPRGTHRAVRSPGHRG